MVERKLNGELTRAETAKTNYNGETHAKMANVTQTTHSLYELVQNGKPRAKIAECKLKRQGNKAKCKLKKQNAS